jgi:hypothetical protein
MPFSGSVHKRAWLLTVPALCLLMPRTAESQQQRFLWSAKVVPAEVDVYSSDSANVGIITTLNRGELVNVVLEVNATGDEWCRIGLPSQPLALGYVLCKSLEKVVAKSSIQSESGTSPRVQEALVTQPTAPVVANTESAALTNKDVLEMSKIGLSSDILIAKIKSSLCNFDTSPSQLQQLKSSGLADSVILAMVEVPAGPARMATSDPPAHVGDPPKDPPPAPSDGKIRVFVTDSQSWETRGGGSAGGTRNGWGASSWISGGARPQTAEIIKTVNQRCPELTVTNNLSKADFVLTLDHEGGKSLLAHRNKVAVFNRDGDDIFSDSTRELGSSVKDACQAMLNSKK